MWINMNSCDLWHLVYVSAVRWDWVGTHLQFVRPWGNPFWLHQLISKCIVFLTFHLYIYKTDSPQVLLNSAAFPSLLCNQNRQTKKFWVNMSNGHPLIPNIPIQMQMFAFRDKMFWIHLHWQYRVMHGQIHLHQVCWGNMNPLGCHEADHFQRYMVLWKSTEWFHWLHLSSAHPSRSSV